MSPVGINSQGKIFVPDRSREPMTFAGIGSDGIYQSCIMDVLSEGELT